MSTTAEPPVGTDEISDIDPGVLSALTRKELLALLTVVDSLLTEEPLFERVGDAAVSPAIIDLAQREEAIVRELRERDEPG